MPIDSGNPASAAKGRWRAIQRTKLYDVLAALPMFAWYSVTAGSILKALGKKFAALRPEDIDFRFIIGVLNEGAAIVFVLMILFFVLLRKPAEAKAKGLMPRLSAIFGTYFGIGVAWLPARDLNLSFSLMSLVLMLSGIGFSIYALKHLGRSFSLMAEARQLVTDGPYAHVRHPLYLGEAISMFGLVMQYASVLAFAILAVQLAFQLERMKNEERILGTLFPAYDAYRVKTARLIPGIY